MEIIIFDTAVKTFGIIMGIATALAMNVLLAAIAMVILGLVTNIVTWVQKKIKGGK